MVDNSTYPVEIYNDPGDALNNTNCSGVVNVPIENLPPDIQDNIHQHVNGYHIFLAQNNQSNTALTEAYPDGMAGIGYGIATPDTVFHLPDCMNVTQYATEVLSKMHWDQVAQYLIHHLC
jgi:hypothetical protein